MKNTIIKNNFLSQLSSIAETQPKKIALFSGDGISFSYKELSDQIITLVNDLNFFGVSKYDKLAIVLPNGLEHACVTLAAIEAGIAVPINPDYREAEYDQVFERLSPKYLIIFSDEDHPARLAAKKHEVKELELIKTTSGNFKFANVGCITSPIIPSSSDLPSLILFTSGSTSRPKAVPLSQDNLVSSAESLIASLNLNSNDSVLHFLPMYHVGGIVDVLIAPLLSGGSVFCSMSFSSHGFYKDLKRFNPTWVQAAPVMIQEMLGSHESFSDVIKSHQLRLMRSVSAPLSPTTMQQFESIFKIPVIEIFGMTETAGVITSNPLPPKQRKAGSVGMPINADIKILGHDGSSLSFNQIGHVVVSSKGLMLGYYDESESHHLYFNEDGFRTGDLGYLDEEGYLHITGRVKDIINRGGEKITPLEVDRVILSHPYVVDAACFPIPHETLGEDIAAIFVVEEKKELDSKALSLWLRQHLAHFKVPNKLIAVNSIPRNNGKLQRKLLAERFSSVTTLENDQVLFEAPETIVAKFIASVWANILNSSNIGLNDNFFSLGGNSLKAASFINQLQQDWKKPIYVSSLFDAPTVAEYEKFLFKNYPEAISLILGADLEIDPDDFNKLRPEDIATFKAKIVHPSPSLKSTKKNKKAVFILSAPRSGSTLLRTMLAGHSSLFSPPELYLLSFDNLVDRKKWYSGSQRFQLEGNLRALMQARNESLDSVNELMLSLENRRCTTHEYYGLLQNWIGEQILVDKTPAYAIDLKVLQQAEDSFDQACYIYLYRHPYGMIRSFEEAKLDQLWSPRLQGVSSEEPVQVSFNRRQMAEMIWLILNENILTFLKSIPSSRQLFVPFEDLVNKPSNEMHKVCDMLGLSYMDSMINPQSDQKARMTDGVHAMSKMIGDPKFHYHKKIDPSIADQWKSAYTIDFLSDETWQLANVLGYQETLCDVLGRVELVL